MQRNSFAGTLTHEELVKLGDQQCGEQDDEDDHQYTVKDVEGRVIETYDSSKDDNESGSDEHPSDVDFGDGEVNIPDVDVPWNEGKGNKLHMKKIKLEFGDNPGDFETRVITDLDEYKDCMSAAAKEHAGRNVAKWEERFKPVTSWPRHEKVTDDAIKQTAIRFPGSIPSNWLEEMGWSPDKSKMASVKPPPKAESTTDGQPALSMSKSAIKRRNKREREERIQAKLRSIKVEGGAKKEEEGSGDPIPESKGAETTEVGGPSVGGSIAPPTTQDMDITPPDTSPTTPLPPPSQSKSAKRHRAARAKKARLAAEASSDLKFESSLPDPTKIDPSPQPTTSTSTPTTPQQPLSQSASARRRRNQRARAAAQKVEDANAFLAAYGGDGEVVVADDITVREGPVPSVGGTVRDEPVASVGGADGGKRKREEGKGEEGREKGSKRASQVRRDERRRLERVGGFVEGTVTEESGKGMDEIDLSKEGNRVRYLKGIRDGWGSKEQREGSVRGDAEKDSGGEGDVEGGDGEKDVGWTAVKRKRKRGGGEKGKKSGGGEKGKEKRVEGEGREKRSEEGHLDADSDTSLSPVSSSCSSYYSSDNGPPSDPEYTPTTTTTSNQTIITTDPDLTTTGFQAGDYRYHATRFKTDVNYAEPSTDGEDDTESTTYASPHRIPLPPTPSSYYVGPSPMRNETDFVGVCLFTPGTEGVGVSPGRSGTGVVGASPGRSGTESEPIRVPKGRKMRLDESEDEDEAFVDGMRACQGDGDVGFVGGASPWGGIIYSEDEEGSGGSNGSARRRKRPTPRIVISSDEEGGGGGDQESYDGMNVSPSPSSFDEYDEDEDEEEEEEGSVSSGSNYSAGSSGGGKRGKGKRKKGKKWKKKGEKEKKKRGEREGSSKSKSQEPINWDTAALPEGWEKVVDEEGLMLFEHLLDELTNPPTLTPPLGTNVHHNNNHLLASPDDRTAYYLHLPRIVPTLIILALAWATEFFAWSGPIPAPSGNDCRGWQEAVYAFAFGAGKDNKNNPRPTSGEWCEGMWRRIQVYYRHWAVQLVFKIVRNQFKIWFPQLYEVYDAVYCITCAFMLVAYNPRNVGWKDRLTRKQKRARRRNKRLNNKGGGKKGQGNGPKKDDGTKRAKKRKMGLWQRWRILRLLCLMWPRPFCYWGHRKLDEDKENKLMPQTRRSTLHRDRRDAKRGYCWILCYSSPQNTSSTGSSYLYLPTLGRRIHIQAGDLICLRSYLLPHEIQDVEQNRGCLVFFMHDDQFMWSAKQRGKSWLKGVDGDEFVRENFGTREELERKIGVVRKFCGLRD
ncbi:hypothetical protein HDV00_008506 [Rhizophlyctis rosea]|nr:hypothetical protein HDV00_008506 [Rhizophlyctis rosea]